MDKNDYRKKFPDIAGYILEHASVCAMFMDPQGAVSYMNKAARSVLGYAEEDLSSKYIFDIDLLVTRETWQEYWNTLKEPGPCSSESKYLMQSGRIIPVGCITDYICCNGTEYACTFFHDMTQRTVERETTRKNEEKFRDIFEGVSDAWYFHDLQGKFLETNPAFRKMFGFTDQHPFPEELRVIDLVPGNLKPMVKEYLDTILREGKNEGLIKVANVNGDERIIEYKNTLVMGDGGKPVGIRGTGRDITDRYRHRKEMKEVEQRYHDIFDHITDLLFFHDLDGNFDLKQCNPAVRQQLVGGNPDIATVNIRKFMPEPYREGFDDYLDRVRKKGMDEGLFTIINHAGREVVMEYRNSLVMGKTGPIGIRGSARDITERIVYERALRKSEEKYSTLLENIEHGYYEVDIKGDVTFINDSITRIFGIPKEELLGSNFRAFTDKATAGRLRETFTTVYESGKDLKSTEWEFITKDGRKIYLEASISRNMSRSGKCKGFRGLVRDVTARVLTEQALKEGESKYRSILENIEEGYYEVDLEGTFTFFNDSFCRIFGIPRHNLMGKSFRSYVPEELAKNVYTAFHELYTSGTGLNLSDWEFTKLDDGRKIIIETSVYRIVSDDGRCRGFRGIVRDVTHRVQAEKAIMESEQRYRLLAENVNDIIWTTDLDYRFTYVSPWVHQVARSTPEETLKLGVSHVMDKEIFQRIHDDFEGILERIRRGEPSVDTVRRYEFEHGRGDGTTFWADTIATVQSDNKGKPIGFVGITRDITERKKSEEEIRKNEAKYRSILEGMEEGYFETDLAGNFNFLNDAICRMIGVTRVEMQGMNYRQCMDEENANHVFREFHRVFETGKSGKFQWIFTGRAGTSIQVESSIQLIRDEKGKGIGFRGVVQDITSRKKVEEETRLLEEKLKNAQKMEALGTLAGGVAHDLNNILSGVVSYPEILLMTLSEDSHLKEPLKKIQKSGERAAAVVQDLLTLARRGVALKEILNLNDIIKEYINSPEFQRLESLHPNIRIRFVPDESLFNINGSPSHLSKSIMNLVANAAEAMPEGGTVTLETENTKDPNNKGSSGEYVCLRVIDTGMGISDEDMSRIFEPFYTKKKMGRSGTGLGLAVVWGTVQDHNGHIDVDCRDGKTVFTLYFPSTLNKMPEIRTHIPLKDYMGNGEQILVVDDNEEQCEMASDMLKFLGYQVITVSSGEDAISYLKDHATDLLLLDMIMEQGIDGLETYEKILEIHPGQKAVIASGYSETDRVRKTLMLGAGRYIRKPYLIEDLGIAVKLEIQKKSGKR